ncbi:MAG TPA: HD domain-containing phosphohydrolase, partial [Acidimicrobiales bacterium]|nr:HD domain-containing phosphohydrolase [Acidimicrobiales bacterium]
MGYGLPVESGMRSCILGVALARRLDLPDAVQADTFYGSLLAHVGCVGFSHEMSAAFGDDLRANRAGARTDFADPRDIFRTLIPETVRGLPRRSQVRMGAFIVTRGRGFGRRYDTTTCELGRETARRIGLPDSVQGTLYQVREWWNGGGSPQGLAGDAIAISARVARVAADAALFEGIGGTDQAVTALERRAGGVLDPAIVAAFAEGAPELFAETAGDPRERMLALEPHPHVETDRTDLPTVAAAFGDLADLKSLFTLGHSQGVARLATAAAEQLALESEVVEQVQVAALLHDLGRVGVANQVWEREGALTAGEWEQVRLHAYYSERILAASPALEPVAALAGMHHERLDGSGYHRGCRGGDLPTSARVLAAADAFHAMIQARPHRAAVGPGRAAEELRDAAR